jgi:hypothetical protein
MPLNSLTASLWQRLLSYFLPVSITKATDEEGEPLEVMLYRNNWQLAARTALYSDGIQYRPFQLAFRRLPPHKIQEFQTCLLLGAGLGSVVQMLHHKFGANCSYQLVEKEEQILHWSTSILKEQGIKEIIPYCGDALTFMQKNKKQYNLICLDIFNGRVVPAVFVTNGFMQLCRQALQSGGVWIMNYMVNDPEEWEVLQANSRKCFGKVDIIESDENRILIAEV